VDLQDQLLSAVRKIEFPRKLGIIDRIFGRLLSSRGVTYVETGSHLRWKLDLRNSTDRWIVYGYYDPAFLPWAKNFLPQDGVVVESGANIGQMTMYLGQYVPKGRLFDFEPGTRQADWLTECVENNRKYLPSVEIHRVGLGAVSERLFLRSVGEEITHGGQMQVDELEGEPIELVRLEDFLNQRNVDHVDIWKLDVEGHEIPALEGAGAFLKEKRIRALYVELTGENGLRIREYLSKLGYQCYQFTRYRRHLVKEKNPLDWGNGLFLPD